jgi:hypothetical protein
MNAASDRLGIYALDISDEASYLVGARSYQRGGGRDSLWWFPLSWPRMRLPTSLSNRSRGPSSSRPGPNVPAMITPSRVNVDGNTGSAHGVAVSGFSNVTIRNCKIRHALGRGINGFNAPNLTIHDCDIVCIGAPAVGQNPSDAMNNIEGNNCDGIRIDRVRLRDGSTGVYLVFCEDARISFVEGYNFRGPFPRGQVVQFNQCLDPLLEDFSVINQGDVAWTEDCVNSFLSRNPHIRRGFIRGNNSGSGQGIIVETRAPADQRGGLIEDVDVVYWGNGGFMASSYPGNQGGGVQFWRCRARDGIDESPNNSEGDLDYEGNTIPNWATFVGALVRGTPISGSEAFFAFGTTPDIEFHACEYFNLPQAVAYDRDLMTLEEFTEVDFLPRHPIQLTFQWEQTGSQVVSRINPSKPEDAVPASKSDLRANLQAAKDEIEALMWHTLPWRVVTTNYTLQAADFGTALVVDSSSIVTITCPADLNPETSTLRRIFVFRKGAGAVSFAANGVTILSPGGRLTIPERYGSAIANLMDAETVWLEGI